MEPRWYVAGVLLVIILLMWSQDAMSMPIKCRRK